MSISFFISSQWDFNFIFLKLSRFMYATGLCSNWINVNKPKGSEIAFKSLHAAVCERISVYYRTVIQPPFTPTVWVSILQQLLFPILFDKMIGKF